MKVVFHGRQKHESALKFKVGEIAKSDNGAAEVMHLGCRRI